jgi:hypothetical protein
VHAISEVAFDFYSFNEEASIRHVEQRQDDRAYRKSTAFTYD